MINKLTMLIQATYPEIIVKNEGEEGFDIFLDKLKIGNLLDRGDSSYTLSIYAKEDIFKNIFGDEVINKDGKHHSIKIKIENQQLRLTVVNFIMDVPTLFHKLKEAAQKGNLNFVKNYTDENGEVQVKDNKNRTFNISVGDFNFEYIFDNKGLLFYDYQTEEQEERYNELRELFIAFIESIESKNTQ